MLTVSEPAVSVIIPAYRASADIPDALESVFAQTFSSFEVIVVDDGSPDAAELEEAIAPFRDRIRFIRQTNRGAGAARNTGIRAARGPYIAFLDADDRWHHDFLRRQTWFLDAYADCDLVYTDASISGETPLAGRRFMEAAPSSGDVTLLSLLSQQCNIMLSTVVVRREPLVASGLFDETLRRGHDFDLWLRLALGGARMRYQQAVLAERRARADGLSGGPVAEIERALDVLDRFGHRHALDHQARTAQRIRMMALVDRLEIEQAKLRIIEGNFSAASYHLNSARDRPWKVQLALMTLRIAPRLLRAVYLRVRPPVWKTTPLVVR